MLPCFKLDSVTLVKLADKEPLTSLDDKQVKAREII